MDQLQLSLLGCVDGPGAVPVDEVVRAQSYREAVVGCYLRRRVRGMSRRAICEITGMRESHIGEYLSQQTHDGKGRELREMPAKFLPKFEAAMGNTFVTQWLRMESEREVAEALRHAA